MSLSAPFVTPIPRALRLAWHFALRDLRGRFLGSFSGALWAVLQPLVQLLVYVLVFGYVFKARVPGDSAPAYVAFLAVAMWPWLAFSEAVQRGTTTVQDNAALLAKVAVPRLSLTAAPVLASFMLHGVGFLAVLAALSVSSSVSLMGLPLAIGGFVLLLLAALGVANLLASLQVFVRDIAPALPQLLMLCMFLSPVFYARESLPPRWQPLLDFNPYTAFAEGFRWALLGAPAPGLRACVVAGVFCLASLWLGLAVFRRLSPHFEDFL